MKRISIYLMVIAAIFTSCDPMEDINADIDSQDNPVVGNVDYTLTADDYADLDLSFGSFNSEDEAKSLLPAFLSEKYPYYGEGSSVKVGYRLFRGNAEGVSDFTAAEVYTLTNDDYADAGSDASGFYPNVDATSQIPGILDAQIDGALEGQIILAKYQQYLETPVIGFANVASYDFAGSFAGWTNFDLLFEGLGWTSAEAYVQGNGFAGGQIANIDWLVSPEIDLTDETEVKFQISQAINFANDLSLLKILVSTDYDGDVTTATWEEITLETAPVGNSNDFILSELYDFSAYDGMMVNIALKYESTATDAGRWRVESLSLKTQGVSGDTDKKGEYFMYNGSTWVAVDDVYYLSSEDFDSMGEESGQPGRFDNFGSNIPADNYLPQFLSIKYPYAQEGDELFVIYDYFSSSSGAQIRGNVYTYNGMEWVAYQSTISTTLQFGYEDRMWVPDNTIRYTLGGADFALIGSTLADEPGFAAAASSASNFNNFDRRSSGTAIWTDEMILRALNVVLDNIAPNAAEGQKYLVTAAVYIGSASTETFRVIKEGGVWVYQE